MNLQPQLKREVYGVYITKSPDHIFLISVGPVEMDASSVLVKVVPVPRTDTHFHANFFTSCVDIVVGAHDMCRGLWISEEEKDTNRDFTHIKALAHSKNCSVTDPLSTKQGTKQMFLSTLALCVKIIGVTKLQLIDASHFMCEDMVVDLYLHNMLVYGQSWYERKYGAIPAHRNSRAALHRAKQALAQAVSNPIAQALIESIDDEEVKAKIQMHIGVSSWNRLFASINAEHGCGFFSFDLMQTLQEYFEIPVVSHWDLSGLLQTNLDQYLVSYEKIY